MDPNSGRLYESVEDAKADGVENPVEVIGLPEDVQRISNTMAAAYRKRARKAQKASRKANRPK